MKSLPAKKWLGAVMAALTLTVVASVAPASAAVTTGDDRSFTMKDSGWD